MAKIEKLWCAFGVPPPTYIKGGRRRPARGGGAPGGGNPIPSRIRPPFPIPTRRRGKEREERRKGGPAPLVQFGLG